MEKSKNKLTQYVHTIIIFLKIDFTSFLAWTFINYLVYCESCRVGDVIFRLRTHNTQFFLFFLKKINIRSGIIIDLNAYQSKIVFCSGKKMSTLQQIKICKTKKFSQKISFTINYQKKIYYKCVSMNCFNFRGDFHNIILLTFKMIILAAKCTG